MLSYDEEIGCLGAPSMIAAASEALPKPAAVIVGEPTGMRMATAHKADEFIERSELAACERFLDRAVAVQCGDQA